MGKKLSYPIFFEAICLGLPPCLFFRQPVTPSANLLIKNNADCEAEKTEVYLSGLESSPWQHFDQTAARVGGVNHTTNVICNPLYTVYLTTPKKDRLTVLKGLQNTKELEFILNQLTTELLTNFPLPNN